MMKIFKFNPSCRALYEKDKTSFSPLDMLFIIIFIVLIAVMIFVTLFSKCEIKGTSMMNTLKDGDNILITNYKTEYKNNDIVIIEIPGESDPLVKRIVATAGEKFYFYTSGGYVFLYKQTIEGTFLSVNESYILEPMLSGSFDETHFSLYDPINPDTIYTVPEGCVLFLGDNRNISKDSRFYSYSKTDWIAGKMVCLIKPDSILELFINILFKKPSSLSIYTH